MLIPKHIIKPIALILVVLMLQSCAIYKPVPASTSSMPSFQGRYVKLVWTDEVVTRKSVFSTWQYDVEKACYLTDISIQGDSLRGVVQQSRPHIKRKHQVNLYLSEKSAAPDSMSGNFALHLSSIRKLELLDLNLGMSILASVVTGVVISAVLFVALVVIVILTKESCPFVYSFNGTDYELTGEIYSGAVNPGLERHDYLPLPNLKPADSQYKLKISNQMQEIQSTNLTELMVIDHPLGSQVLVDKYGVCQTMHNLQSPTSAHTNLNTNILPLLAARDELKHLGDLDLADKNSFETMYLSFDKPKDAKVAKLVVRAKNSFWLDYTMGQFFSQFGDKYKHWYRKQTHSPAIQQQKWSLEQGIPLSVYIKQNGEWQFVDYYNVVGPIAEKDMVMPIDISRLGSGPVELKLESGFLFWETDYAGMDFSAAQAFEVQTVPLQKATDNKGKDVRKSLTADDKKYFVMPNIGDEAILEYSVPHATDGLQRSVFLHSKGYYEVIRKPHGKPDVAHLKTFMQAGKFSDYSRELYLQTKQQVSR